MLRTASTPVVAEALLDDEFDHVQRYIDAITPEIDAAIAAGAASVDAGVPTVIDLSAVHDVIRQGLVIGLRERLARSITDWSENLDDVMRHVRAVYREWKTQHINDEVADALRLAWGTAVVTSVPTGTPMCWIVDPDGPACPDAEDNSLAGVVGACDAYPTGHRLAPAHPGCRCLVVRADR